MSSGSGTGPGVAELGLVGRPCQSEPPVGTSPACAHKRRRERALRVVVVGAVALDAAQPVAGEARDEALELGVAQRSEYGCASTGAPPLAATSSTASSGVSEPAST